MIRSRQAPPSESVTQEDETAMGRGRYPRGPSRKSSAAPSAMLIMGAMILLTFVVIVLLAVGIFSGPGGSSQSADVNSAHHDNPERITTEVSTEDTPHEKWVEVISWEPRAFIYHNFLSKEECDYLIEIAKPSMIRSTVVDGKGGSKDSRVRTSSGTFLPRGRDKIVRDIEQRIADFTFIPVEHGEGLQVLHYEPGQKYEPHHDYFSDSFNTKNGGQRIATVLMYLSDVEEGGETVFPAAVGNFTSVPWWNQLSECGKTGLSVKPKMGDALLFWSMKPDASTDPSSLHGGCPVIRGNKWSSTKWLRMNEYAV